MYIEVEKCYFGITLGINLARLEFLWGSSFAEATDAFDVAKADILRMIHPDRIVVDDQSFTSFSLSIINHYMAKDIEIFYLILIGNCLQRSKMIGASKDDSHNIKISELAASSLDSIGEDVIGNKLQFFSFICEQVASNLSLHHIIQNIHNYLNKLHTTSSSTSVHNTNKNISTNYQIFISYRRDGGDALAGRLTDRFRALGYKVFYDVESMRSGAFNTQILDAIAQCNDVLLVLPPNALDRCISADDWVRQELAFALKHKKNIIPIMMRGFEFPKNLPSDIDAIRNMEGVTASSEYFDAVIQRIEQLLHSSKEQVLNKSNFIGDYASFISSITVSDYLNTELFIKDNPDYKITGGVFYICQKILEPNSLDESTRKEFEQIHFVSKLLYKLAEDKGYTDLCSLMRTVSLDNYIQGSTDIKQYLLEEYENLQGEFIDLIWKSLSSNQNDSNTKEYWERLLKEVFIWLKLCSK